MTIAREEIFGPVLCILGYDDIDHAVEIANDTEYGLAGFISGADLDKARDGGPQDPRRLGDDQSRVRHECAVRRLQAQRQRARVERVTASTSIWRSRARWATHQHRPRKLLRRR